MQSDVRGVSSYGSETSVSDLPICKLSFYLKCCSVGCGITLNLDPMLIDYNNVHRLPGQAQRVIFETVLRELPPERLLNRVLYLDDSHTVLPPNAANAFYAIETASRFAPSLVGSHLHHPLVGHLQVHKIMLCTSEWLDEYYFSPIQTLKRQTTESLDSTLAGPLPQLSPIVASDGRCRILHRGLPCVGCHAEIEGNRYSCATCSGIELCQQCYEGSVHDDTHPFYCHERHGIPPFAVAPRVTTMSGGGAVFQSGNVPTAEAVPISECKTCEQHEVASTAASSSAATSLEPTASFSAGQVVRLVGLSTIHMNGKEALVVSVGAEKIHVRLIGEQDVHVYSVRPDNLVQIAGNEMNNSGPLELI